MSKINKNLILHIGTNKTGSTTIQNFLRGNSHALANEGYFYPMAGAYYYPSESSPSLLAHALLEKQPRYIGDTKIDKASCISDIRRDIISSNCTNVIISSEHFSKANETRKIQNIFNIFKDLFKTMKVIIYLRRQDNYIESMWSQRVKLGLLTKSFDDFCAESLKNSNALDYWQLLAPWSEVFGKENLIIKPFEKKQFVNSDLLTDFLNCIDCKLEPVNIPLQNTSPSTEYLETLRMFTTLIPDVNERMLFARIFRQLPINLDNKKYTFFSHEKRKLFLARFNESNQRIAREYLAKQDGVLFHEKEQSDLPVYSGIKVERFLEISRNLIVLLIKNRIKHTKF
jgi:hypothetical protein